MSAITESELVDYVKAGVVKELVITQGQNEKFTLTVQLTWKPGDFKVFTWRKEIREWANLDRLCRHIRENYGAIPKISLELFFNGKGSKDERSSVKRKVAARKKPPAKAPAKKRKATPAKRPAK